MGSTRMLSGASGVAGGRRDATNAPAVLILWAVDARGDCGLPISDPESGSACCPVVHHLRQTLRGPIPQRARETLSQCREHCRSSGRRRAIPSWPALGRERTRRISCMEVTWSPAFVLKFHQPLVAGVLRKGSWNTLGSNASVYPDFGRFSGMNNSLLPFASKLTTRI